MEEKKIILIGPPNVGKSVLFNSLTGSHVVAANYSGTTVEYTRGRFVLSNFSAQLIDTPGLYALPPSGEDELTTVRLLESTEFDLLIYVIDAKHIRRMIPLVNYFIMQRMPIILVINMIDEAKELGIKIDFSGISSELNIPIVPVAAAKGWGVSSLRKAIASFPFGKKMHCDMNYTQWTKETIDIDEIMSRWIKIGRIPSIGILDNLLRRPLTGLPILVCLLYLCLYQFVGVFGAGFLVDKIREGLTIAVDPLVSQFVNDLVVVPWFRMIIIGPYGIYSLGIVYATGIVMPIVGLFFFVFSILEDSGYLPRMAMLLDSLFKKIGLNGKAVIPLTLGFGCGTLAVLATRTLETRRERILAGFLLSLAIPCSAQLGIMISVLASNRNLLGIWCLYMIGVFLVAGYLGNKVLNGKCTPFLMEIPPLRLPLLRQVIKKTWYKVARYFTEILPIFIAISLFLSVLDYYGLMQWLINLLAPVLGILQLPPVMAEVFLLGFFRRDYGAAGLYNLCANGALTGSQMLTAALLLTLCMPCAAQLLMMVKERGAIGTLIIFCLTILIAISIAWSATQFTIGG